MHHDYIKPVCYLASNLPREGIHHLLHAVVCENRRVEKELCVCELVSVYMEAVRHQRVPVVELAELQRDAVAILEVTVEQQRGVKLQLQKVATEVLHVLLYHDSDCLTCEKYREDAKRTHSD